MCARLLSGVEIGKTWAHPALFQQQSLQALHGQLSWSQPPSRTDRVVCSYGTAGGESANSTARSGISGEGYRLQIKDVLGTSMRPAVIF